MKKILLAALLLAFGSTGWGQNAFLKYGPAAGIQKNTGSTPYDTAAVAADIVGLWTGTCSASTFLRGDGACAAAPGTITSVSLAVPGGLSVTGSPCASGACSFTVSTALSGVLKGNGSAFTTATAADIYGLWSGTCSSSTFLRGDGSCASPGSGSPGGANTQVQYNSSGSFAGNSGFTYDGSGNITLTGRVSAAGTNNQFGATSAQSFGTVVNASTDASHYALHEATDVNGNQIVMGVNASGSTQVNLPTGTVGIGTTSVLPLYIATAKGVVIPTPTTSGTALTVGSSVVVGAPTGGDEGAGSINAQSLYINGTKVAPIVHLASCYVTQSGTTATLTNIQGCSSITRTSAGVYTLNFVAGTFTSTRPACAASGYGNALIYSFADPSNNTTVQVNAANGSATPTDGTGFFINCSGF